jgi:WXXGXW repeat (2 copies)
MRHVLACSALGAALLMSAAPANAQVSIGITIGQPPPPQVYRVPARPNPDFIWVEGYWYPQGHHYKWHDGYWTRPPFAGAYWVEPYYRHGQYFDGYWDGGRGRFDHHHEWDHDRDRRDEDRSDHDEHHDKHH